jgi:hypothetical protein
MFKLSFTAVLLLAAASAVAQPIVTAPEPRGQLQQASMAFGQCVQTGITGLPASVTPEAGAAAVLAGCSSPRQALENAAQSFIVTLPEAEQASAREMLRTQFGGIENQIANGIRSSRGEERLRN